MNFLKYEVSSLKYERKVIKYKVVSLRAYLIFVIFFTPTHFEPENVRKFTTKKAPATKQRKFAAQIASRQNSVNYHHREQIDINIAHSVKLHTVYKVAHCV